MKCIKLALQGGEVKFFFAGNFFLQAKAEEVALAASIGDAQVCSALICEKYKFPGFPLF